MSEQAVIDWLLATLPPEAGPVCAGLAARWDLAQPALLFAALLLWALSLLLAAHLWEQMR